MSTPRRTDTDIGWFEAKTRHHRMVIERLLDREWAHVAITGRLLEASAPLHGRPFVLFATRREGSIADIVLRARDGLLLPAFGEDHDQDLDQPGHSRRPADRYRRELRGVIGAPSSLHSTMGLTADVVRAEQMLDLRPRVRVDHVLMTLDREALPAAGALPDGLVVRRASLRDADRLLALREAYELEEVILDPARFNRDECRRRLRQALRRELVYVAEHQGRPVAKASTNTRGVQVDQIGGVFTTPARRRTGLATAVMLALLRDIFRHKKQACLFVKIGNLGALGMYERLGFVARGDYRISYYR